MRLIDADAFKDWLLNRFAKSQDTLVLTLQGFIAEQPTAYDIDKVVEELEENASRYTKKYTTPYGNNGYKDTKAISIHNAIEIVKQGVVSDNVCEWKYDFNANIKTQCKERIKYRVADWKRCPYCGKKIKVVE